MDRLRRRWRIPAGLLVAGLAAAVALAGCGGGDGESASPAMGTADRADARQDDLGAPAPGVQPGRAQPGAERGAEAGAGAPDVPTPPDPAQARTDPRAIIYTGTVTVRVDDGDTDQVADEAVRLVGVAGGFVGSDRRTSDGGQSRATLELRVPADRFTGVVEKLAKLGTEESRAIGTDDVTEQVVDLDARIASQQASVSRTRALLARATTIAEIVSIEGELAEREAELASLEARKRRLSDLTSLSTITLELLGPGVQATDEPDTGFVAGLKAGWRAFTASVEILLTVLGALLPWLIALGIPVAGVVLLIRRLTRRDNPPAGSPPAPPQAAARDAGPPPPPSALAGARVPGARPSDAQATAPRTADPQATGTRKPDAPDAGRGSS